MANIYTERILQEAITQQNRLFWLGLVTELSGTVATSSGVTFTEASYQGYQRQPIDLSVQPSLVDVNVLQLFNSNSLVFPQVYPATGGLDYWPSSTYSYRPSYTFPYCALTVSDKPTLVSVSAGSYSFLYDLSVVLLIPFTPAPVCYGSWTIPSNGNSWLYSFSDPPYFYQDTLVIPPEGLTIYIDTTVLKVCSSSSL